MASVETRAGRKRPRARDAERDERPDQREAQPDQQESLLNSAGEVSMGGCNSGRASGESRQVQN